MKCLVASSISLVFFATFAFAHANEKHVMGTVTEVTERSITVEAKEHQKMTVSVVPGTKFTKGTSEATLKDLRVGDRVVIHAVKQGEQLQAHTVRIGTASPAAGHHHGIQ